MKKMEVVYIPPGELIPYEGNAKQHPPKQVEHIANSIKRFGFKQPIVIDRDKVVVIGHGRLAAAKELKLDSVPVVYADDLSDDDIKALRLADNKTNESEWDTGKLEEELAALSIQGIDMTMFGFDALKELENENPYTQKTDIPQYEVKGEDVSISELFENEKTKELLAEIEQSNIDEETKNFLRISAYRHVVFNYQKIAEFYAGADAEVQRLMERSALVIIDINDAIRNGYTLLRNEIEDIVKGEMEYE